MGIGAAFATGLVKGFTQNIEKEEAKRLAEQAKVDAFEQTALQAVITGKATNKGYSAAADLIKSARQQMKDRKPIDMFGRATDGIDLDFAKLQGTLEDATENYVMVGSVKLEVPEKYFDPSADAKDKANMFMDSLTNKMGTPAQQAAFLSKFRTQEDIRALDAMYRGNLAQWVSARSYDSQGKLLVNIDPAETLPLHTPISSFLGWDVDKNYEVARTAAISKLDPSGKNDLPAGYTILPVGLNGSRGAAAVPLADLGFDTEEAMAGLEGLASFQKMDVNKFLWNFAGQFDSQADFMKGLSHSVKLFNLGASEPKNLEQNMAVGEYLLSESDLKDDALARAYAMIPFVTDMTSPRERTLRKLGIEAYKDLPFEEEFKKLTGQKLGDFQERTSSLFKARKNLTGLVEKLNSSELKAEGFIANTFLSVYGFFGKSGTIDQIRNLVTEGGGYKDATSAAKIDGFMKSELEGVSDDVAAARTLAFIAAGDLARAEDPSGRLSDQDFLRNYRKLGINASGTLDNQITAINTVLDEVDMKYREVEVLNQIVSRGIGGKLTDGDRKLLQGDSRSKFFVQNYYNSGNSTVETGQPVAALPSFESVTTGDRYETYPLMAGKDGASVYRDKQTQALVIVSGNTVSRVIPKADITKALQTGQLLSTKGGVAAPQPTITQLTATQTPTAQPPVPAPVQAGTVDYLEVATKKISGNNEQGYTLEGYPGKYKKVTREDKTIYFEPIK